jgi:mycobactin peptide synthetase MbtE
MAECSFDVHVGDIFGTVMIGATLIMLRPKGLIDIEYLTTVLERKQITCMTSVPSLFHSLFYFVEDLNRQNSLQYMKSIGSAGMNFTEYLFILNIDVYYL